MPLPWRVEMFGGLRVVQSDRTITRFQTQKTGALLAYLALHRNATHSREVLAELLWPAADPVAVRNRLNQAASSLRRQIEPPGITHGSVLISDQRSIRLNPDSIETDVEEFTRNISRAESGMNPADRQALLKRSVDLYVGEFLYGYYSEWVTVEQLRLADMYSSALFDLLDVSRELGDAETAIRAATLLLKDDPLDEGTHCDLMRLYLDSGRPGAAKRQFEELSRILETEQEQPSEESYELNREASAKRTSAAKPMQVVVREPQVEAPATPEPSVPTLPSIPNRFVGREADVSKIRQMLASDGTPVVTILGAGGCGKTRLALQIAHDFSDALDRCSYFVALADVQDASEIPSAIAAAIGIREADNLVRRLRQNERTLLVLDSIEQLADEAAPMVQSLIAEVPGLSCIVTSRRPLHIEAERTYLLAPLPGPTEALPPEDLILNPSVALFVDRAQAALPDFQLTTRNADVVRQLCLRLEGLPLAIELAASWAKTVAPAQMLAMLTDRFTLLESRRRDISARHRTMRAVIDSGVALLPPDLKVLFHRLSVFQGGWTIEAASVVCQRPDVLHAMDALVEQSLIVADSTDRESYRFRMLDTLRDYAAEHLPTADAAESANLHADFFSALASEAEKGLTGPDQAQWLDRLSADFANLSAAFRWYLEHDLISPALELCCSLVPYWEFLGGAQTGIDWLESALLRATRSSQVSSEVVARSRTSLSWLTWIHGKFEKAASMHAACLDLWVGLASPHGIALAQRNIQMEAHRRRDYKKSLELLSDNLAKGHSLEDHDLIERTLLAMGNTFVELKQFDEAREQYEASLKSARQSCNKRRAAVALNNLGNLALLSEQYTVARHSLTQALDQFQQLRAKPHAIEALILLGRLERLLGNIDEAKRNLEQAWSFSPEESYQLQVLFLELAQCSFAVNRAGEAATLLGFVDQLQEDSGALNYDIERQAFEDFEAKLKDTLTSSEYREARRVGRTLELGQAAQIANI